MLDPTFTKIKGVLREKLETDNPPTISVGLDGWSAHHHGYLGMNGHYLNDDWCRVKFCLGCAPFDESHTGENIYQKLTSVLTDWDLLLKTGPCLRDNAKNMVAAFEVEGSVLEGVGCVNHTLQLSIKDEIFNLPSVETLITKCRTLASHANRSNHFYRDFRKNQIELMNKKPNEVQNLKGDVVTR